ncbi:aconitate hydratase [Polyrhizophydium stewartii]|uniref:Aconitate hydratase n=1 Tax=Polyrhizophydium stewartii TaxID=2732419 RepID=A0ABR4N4B6_9FUNG
MLAKRDSCAVPASVHCDHLIAADRGGHSDVAHAESVSGEIFAFLRTASKKYGIDFWRPGSGIIHQIVLENYAFPGGMMLGTDSHTPNAGGLGMIAIGVGGADAVDAMAGIPWELKAPKVLGVRLSGKLDGWATPKDVILKLAGMLTVQGGTNHIIEYFGPGVDTLSCTGMATICNMGAEVGATTSLFPFTESMRRYLVATGRSEVAEAAAKAKEHLCADAGAEYDSVVEINLSELAPRLNGPATPDRSWTLPELKTGIAENKWPKTVSAALIGSCTNSSYEDMTRAASIVKQALGQGMKAKVPFLITPGSEQIRATMHRDGLLDVFQQAGGTILANACGPCIGQWNRPKEESSAENAIVSSFNRNFKGRNDGSPKTLNFLGSPEARRPSAPKHPSPLVTAMAFSGQLAFDPTTDVVTRPDGSTFRFAPPQGIELPPQGFDEAATRGWVESSAPDSSVQVKVDPASSRLQLIEPFAPWDGKEISGARLLVKVSGKCTTDHISAAGPWLKFKGHLENISRNTLIGATNAFTGQVNSTTNWLTGEQGTNPDVAFAYRDAAQPWVVVGDWNYGEGSAREHAAMQPRFLGCVAVVCRSFARIHETNLKKQGIVPLTFVNPDDYDRIPADAVLATRGLVGLAPGSPVILEVARPSEPGAPAVEIPLAHTMSRDQIEWFRAGSALNAIAAQ